MNKRVTLTDDELEILRTFVRDNLNTTLLSSHWVFQKITHRNLERLLNKLEDSPVNTNKTDDQQDGEAA